MKKYIILAFSTLALASCSFLDVSTSEYHDTEYQFATFDRVKSMMTNVYGRLQDQFNSEPREVATDNGINAYYMDSPGVSRYYNGSWTVNNRIDDQWSNFYGGIRAANYFIENCPDDFPASRYLDEYPQRMEQLKYYKWEARALRAFYHFELLRRYNKIIIADHCFEMEEVNGLKQSDYQTTARWIADECDAVAEYLPDSYARTWAGDVKRVTRPFALALKVRTLLYAASPLNTADHKYDADLCAEAAATALTLMSMPAFHMSAQNKFNDDESLDLVFGITRSAGTGFEGVNFPMGFEGGNGGACPSENLASAFEMSNGTKFDWNNPSHRANPYLNRDPRFYRTIYYNGCPFKGTVLETYVGGTHGEKPGVKGSTPTSYYLAKLIVEDTDLTDGHVVSYYHVWPVFRIQEMYLSYAEALFEASGNPDFKGELEGYEFPISPREALNNVRSAVGMPPYLGGSVDEFREKVRNERRVEFAFEDFRFWDIRRWMIAGDPEVLSLKGMRITKSGSTVEYGDPVEIQGPSGSLVYTKRVWNDCYYFFPIPKSETFKNVNLEQSHPGWNTL